MFGRLFLLFVAVLTAGQVLFFHHLNALFNAQKAGTEQEIERIMNTSNTLSPQAQQILMRLKQQYQGVTVSPNGQYATYIDTASDGTNIVVVESLKTGKQVSEATNLYPVQYLDWLGDEEVFVGEQKSPSDLELNTFYVSNGQQADITAASVPIFSGLASDAKITKVTYSSQTNDVFVLIDSSSSSVLYHIGTMEDVQRVPFNGGYVKNIALSQTGDNLYVEDNQDGNWNVVRLHQSSSANSYSPEYDVNEQVVQSNAALITVIMNVLYYGEINQNGLVTAVYKKETNGSVTLIKRLASPAIASEIVVSNSGNVTVNPIATSSATV